MEPQQGIQNFLEYVVGFLARRKDGMSITQREEGEGKFQYTIKVDMHDTSRVLGKENRGISALKNLAAAAGAAQGLKVRVYFDGPMKSGGGGPRGGGGGRGGFDPRKRRGPGGPRGGGRDRRSGDGFRGISGRYD